MAISSLSPPGLSAEEIRRYARHLVLPHVGAEGQRRLKEARVLLIGVGGLGSPAALYLAAAGVGALGLVDHDDVEFSNLQRQILYGTRDVGRPKLQAARDRIVDANPNVDVTTHDARLTSSNAIGILADYDVVVDGSDNFPTRYLVSDACAMLGKPDVYGSIHRFEGQVSVFWAARGPCYRCLYRDPPPPESVPSCAEGGVLGVLPGIVGALQAAEAIKLVLGAGEALVGRLLVIDALTMRFRELALEKDPACPVCGEQPTVTSLIDYDAFCAGAGDAGGAPRRAKERATMDVTATTLREELARGEKLVLLDVREEWEVELCGIPGSLHVPLAELPGRMAELEPHARVVTICHKGARSLQAAHFLQANGFAGARSLQGGVDAWAVNVDPAMARY